MDTVQEAVEQQFKAELGNDMTVVRKPNWYTTLRYRKEDQITGAEYDLLRQKYGLAAPQLTDQEQRMVEKEAKRAGRI